MDEQDRWSVRLAPLAHVQPAAASPHRVLLHLPDPLLIWCKLAWPAPVIRVSMRCAGLSSRASCCVASSLIGRMRDRDSKPSCQVNSRRLGRRMPRRQRIPPDGDDPAVEDIDGGAGSTGGGPGSLSAVLGLSVCSDGREDGGAGSTGGRPGSLSAVLGLSVCSDRCDWQGCAEENRRHCRGGRSPDGVWLPIHDSHLLYRADPVYKADPARTTHPRCSRRRAASASNEAQRTGHLRH